MSYFRGFGTANSNGQFWFGGNSFPGFIFKKNGGAGGHKNPKYGLICNRPTTLYNKYISGAGVGASNVSNRRAKRRFASTCTSFCNLKIIVPIIVPISLGIIDTIFNKNVDISENLVLPYLNTNRVLITDSSKNVVSSSVTSTTISYLSGLTSNLQSQLNNKIEVYDNSTGTKVSKPIIYFGTGTSSSSADATVTFPTAFTNIFVVIALQVTDVKRTLAINDVSNASFDFNIFSYEANGARSQRSMNWIAIGN
jgi:hypothetical protein